jgi:hydrophobic/amphiphilic exporter-1 (mainly G- bacteria), HAE1 family
MWLTRIAIHRPMYLLLAITTIIGMGLLSWTRLGVELFPKLDYPYVTVTTVYPGAGPDAVDTLVTRKIEEVLADLNEVDVIQSTSTEGVSSIAIAFTERASKDSPQEVERKVNTVREKLPLDAKAPIIAKYEANAVPVLVFALTGPRTLGQLQTLGEDVVKDQLERIPGVARVSLVGGTEREVQVHVDQQKLQARGLSILQVNEALARDNLNAPAGNLTEGAREIGVRLNTQAQAAEELADVLVAQTPNGPVYLGDVATVHDTHKKLKIIQRSNGQPAVGVTVIKQASANTIAVADRVKREITRVEDDLPRDVHLAVVSDASTFIKDDISGVRHELVQAVFLTGLVLLLFLHTFRATLIVLMAIPTSLIATLAVMQLLGFSFNMMSLMGLTLTVGILVDDSIVVLENIFRHLQRGEPPQEAAINGRSEIGSAAIAITLVDIVVFVPIGLMTGPVGQWFREFGLVIASATLFSLLVSFTLTPLLASMWYRRQDPSAATAQAPRGAGRLLAKATGAWDRAYGALEDGYARVLRTALRFRWVTVGGGVAAFGAGVMLVTTGMLSSEFLASADNGEIVVKLEMPAGTALEATEAAAARLERRLLGWPEVERVTTTVGQGGDNFEAASQGRYARLLVALTPKATRTRSANELVQEARELGADLPGATVKSAIGGILNGDAPPVRVFVQGEDSRVLGRLAREIASAIRAVPGTVNVSDGGATGQPELVVSIDRRRAADLGLTPGQVASVLRSGIEGAQVSTFRPEGTKGWDLTVYLDPNDRARTDQIGDVPIVTPRGATVKLSQVANIALVDGPTQVERRDRRRTVTVTSYLDGRPSGDVARDVETALQRVAVPAGYTVRQGGDAEDQGEAFGQIFTALGLSLLLMYLLMVALFGSFLTPFIVMLSLPLAIVGAFGLLALTGNTLNIMSMIGLILLTGLVGKNAILLVDYTNTLRRRGVSRDEALLQAGPTRLRPILMTTFAIILAMLPLAMRLGEGAEWRAPTAVTVIGGLATSTLLTLLLIPAVYTLMDDLQVAAARAVAWLKRARQEGGTEPAASPAS